MKSVLIFVRYVNELENQNNLETYFYMNILFTILNFVIITKCYELQNHFRTVHSFKILKYIY